MIDAHAKEISDADPPDLSNFSDFRAPATLLNYANSEYLHFNNM
jgi:hypothetical protein